jgi:hypothetical protein
MFFFGGGIHDYSGGRVNIWGGGVIVSGIIEKEFHANMCVITEIELFEYGAHCS